MPHILHVGGWPILKLLQFRMMTENSGTVAANWMRSKQVCVCRESQSSKEGSLVCRLPSQSPKSKRHQNSLNSLSHS